LVVAALPFQPDAARELGTSLRDGGGHDLQFFWHDVREAPDENWRPHFRRALEAIQERTRALRWRG